jgi:hypothetical protein
MCESGPDLLALHESLEGRQLLQAFGPVGARGTRANPAIRDTSALASLVVPREDLAESWERTRGHLARAWTELPLGVDATWYLECLDTNELELAMEALAELGKTNQVDAGYWLALSNAAEEMGLSERCREYRALSGSA